MYYLYLCCSFALWYLSQRFCFDVDFSETMKEVWIVGPGPTARLKAQGGLLHELHLSHNDLDAQARHGGKWWESSIAFSTSKLLPPSGASFGWSSCPCQASALIIEAAVLAGDSSGKAYPRKVGKGNSAPLWAGDSRRTENEQTETDETERDKQG